MKVLLCCIFSIFCVIIVASGRAHPKMQVTMNDPMYPCPDFDDNKMKINLTGVMFTQNPDDACTLNGKYTIAETIDGPISIRIMSKKYERGTWVNSMLNQNINDICKEMEMEKRPDWLKMFDEWTNDKKCPFIKKQGEYKDLSIYNSKNSPEVILPNIYGKYKSEGRFYQIINGELDDIGCFIVNFEITSV